MDMDKEYTGTFYLGATTPSFDRETEIDKKYSIDHITEDLILKTKELFIGRIKQTPPVYSAVKVDGKPAYIYARKDKPVEIKTREVEISEFEIIRIALPEIDFRISCSKGTYIRSLARDFGKALDSGAYLDSLCRTRIGGFMLEDALTLEEFKIKVL
jgi:tRNA pseudouridine55 synthase